jgi:hypothetical protein
LPLEQGQAVADVVVPGAGVPQAEGDFSEDAVIHRRAEHLLFSVLEGVVGRVKHA